MVKIIDNDFGIIEARIMRESKTDLTGSPGNISLEIANKSEDITSTQTDLERKQQINELYSQGATNMSNYSYNDNADPDDPAEISFYLNEELVRINKLLLSFKTRSFRAYERAIKGGGDKVQWIEGNAEQYFEMIKQHELEGIVQKKADSRYQINKRSHDWLKVINYQYDNVYISGLRKDEFEW